MKGYTFTTKNVSWLKMQKTKLCSFCSAPMSFNFQIRYSDPNELKPVTLPTPATGRPAPSTTPKPEPTTFPTKPPTTTQPPLFPTKCGTPAISPLLNGLKIVNGISSTKNSWPWQALLETAEGGLCGASLINDQVTKISYCI